MEEQPVELLQPEILIEKEKKYLSVLLNIAFILSSCAFAMLLYEASTKIQKYLSIVYYIFYLITLTFLIFKYKQNLLINKLKNINKCTGIITIVSSVCSAIYLALYLDNSIFSLFFNKITLVILSLPFLIVALYFIYEFLINKIIEFYKTLTIQEKRIIFSFFILGLLIIMTSDIFTNMFIGYGSNDWNIEVLSFDVVHFNSVNFFTNFFCIENCIKHTLISLFAFPIFIIPTCVFKLLGIEYAIGLFVQIIQLIMILIIVVLIKRLLKVKSKFVELFIALIFFLSSSFIINTIVYEKFVLATFFIILTVNASIKDSNEKYLYFMGAIGTLTTSIILYPIVFLKKDTKLKDIIVKTLIFAVIFILLLILGGQVNDMFFGYTELTRVVNAFGGSKIGWLDKLAQYFENFAILIFMPNTIVRNNNLWYPKTNIFGWLTIVGFIILLISIIGFIFNKKEKFYQICFYWLLFLTFSDLVIGWGSALNEFFIYSLTYIWAIVPLFCKGLSEIIKNKKLYNITLTIIVVCIFSYNIFRLYEYIEFGAIHFPALINI